MYYYLYQITHIQSQKIYIGVHKTDDLEDGYMGQGTRIKRAITKYGPDAFLKTILEFFDQETAMFSREKEIVNEEFIKRGHSYNVNLGGFGGWHHINSEEAIGFYKNKRIKTRENKSQEDKIKEYQNRSKSTTGEKNPMFGQNRTGNLNPMWGKTHQKNTKTLIGEKSKGKTVVKDKFGNILRVDINDPRIASSEFEHINSGKIVVRDSAGNNLSVHKDDPRFLSGELVSVNKGRILSAERKMGLSKTVSSTKWYNNGLKQIRSSTHPGDDWTHGRLSFKKSHQDLNQPIP